MKKVIALDIEKCIACGACTVACMDQNDINPANGDMPFRTVAAVEQEMNGKLEIRYVSLGCMHCAMPECINACPCGCISRDEETGMVVTDSTNCIGCHSCAMACPFGAPTFDSKGKMRKCDGCYIRQKNGLEPACVKVCPMDALGLYTVEEYMQVEKNKLLRKLIEKSKN